MRNRYGQALRRFLPLCLLFLLPGCQLAVLDPQGSVGVQERNLIVTATWLMLIVVIPVIVLTLVFAWRYRATNTKAVYRPKWSHSNAIEVIVWGVPAAIVFVLAVITWNSTHTLDPYRPLPQEASIKPINVDVVSLDWKWLFIYPDLGVASVNQLAMPVGVPVNFHLTSDAVMNSFFIPRLGTQIYSMAGMITQLHLVADKAGTYPGISANFSGGGFSDMKFNTLALPADQFNAWIQHARAASVHLDPAAYKQLVSPSRANPVEYFSHVTPGLFQSIVTKYDSMPMGGSKHPMVMGAAACRGAKTCSAS